MTKAEKWKKEINRIGIGNIGIINDRPVHCDEVGCSRCKANSYENCSEEIMKWLMEEYVEPKIDPRLKNMPVDTKILVSHDGKNWERRYLYKAYDNGVLAYVDGTTSWTENKYGALAWQYGKLAEE